MDCGRRPHPPKICTQSDPPFRKRWFRQISLNSATAMRASEKNLISTNRKSTTHFPSSHRQTLCFTPKSPKRWLKRECLHLALPFISSLQIIVDISYLIINMWVEHSKSQSTGDCPWKGRGYCHVTSLMFWKISDNISKKVRDSLRVFVKFE